MLMSSLFVVKGMVIYPHIMIKYDDTLDTLNEKLGG